MYEILNQFIYIKKNERDKEIKEIKIIFLISLSCLIPEK